MLYTCCVGIFWFHNTTVMKVLPTRTANTPWRGI
jgi:hypothetical protein